MFTLLLISTYDLGRQSFGLASPAAWLRNAGFQVSCLDLAVQALDENLVRAADVIAFFLPMHTATRLATPFVKRVKVINPSAHLCFYGLYAALNEAYLRNLGGDSILSGEYETGLVELAKRLIGRTDLPANGAQPEPVLSFLRQRFLVPARADLPPLENFAQLNTGTGRKKLIGYTQASRGCKHHCRHCPIVPVYDGRFLIVQKEIVLEDIRQQVSRGAEHITFGDPDFFNGIGHALPIVHALHQEFPELTYDVTIKIEHLIQHAEHLRTLKETGCLFITSAVESIDDRVLEHLNKGHTRQDFIQTIHLCKDAALIFQPTFVAFHPWITIKAYRDLLEFIAQYDLIENVAPIQLALRLLLPSGSKLLDLPEIQALIGPFDEDALVFPWAHPDPDVDKLQTAVQDLVQALTPQGYSRSELFKRVFHLVEETQGGNSYTPDEATTWKDRTPIPFIDEPWYC